MFALRFSYAEEESHNTSKAQVFRGGIMASNGDKLTYFVVGGFIGACVALLFAPKSGQETREFLEGKYREGTDKLTQKAREGRETMAETKGWLTEKAREGKETLAESSRQVKDKVNEKIEEGKGSLARQKDQLSKAVEAGRDAYQKEKGKLEDGKKA
jgi:gas vesicle protein